jgi:hypothetical protein
VSCWFTSAFQNRPNEAPTVKREAEEEYGVSPPPDHWLPGFNFNVEEWFEGDRYGRWRSAARSNWPARVQDCEGRVWPGYGAASSATSERVVEIS